MAGISLHPVAGFIREEPADPTLRVDDVSLVAGNEMKVGMGDGLTGYVATIDPQVHSVEAQISCEPLVKSGQAQATATVRRESG